MMRPETGQRSARVSLGIRLLPLRPTTARRYHVFQMRAPAARSRPVLRREGHKPHARVLSCIARARAAQEVTTRSSRASAISISDSRPNATGNGPVSPHRPEPRMGPQSQTQPQQIRHDPTWRMCPATRIRSSRTTAVRRARTAFAVDAPGIPLFEQTLVQARPWAAGGHRFRPASPVTENLASHERRAHFRIAPAEGWCVAHSPAGDDPATRQAESALNGACARAATAKARSTGFSSCVVQCVFLADPPGKRQHRRSQYHPQAGLSDRASGRPHANIAIVIGDFVTADAGLPPAEGRCGSLRVSPYPSERIAELDCEIEAAHQFR